MLTQGGPVLITKSGFTSLIKATNASTSSALTARACSVLLGSFKLFFLSIELMIFSHLAIVREAIVISPNKSLFCAALCATTQPTPPAPICKIAIISFLLNSYL